MVLTKMTDAPAYAPAPTRPGGFISTGAYNHSTWRLLKSLGHWKALFHPVEPVLHDEAD